MALASSDPLYRGTQTVREKGRIGSQSWVLHANMLTRNMLLGGKSEQRVDHNLTCSSVLSSPLNQIFHHSLTSVSHFDTIVHSLRKLYTFV